MEPAPEERDDAPPQPRWCPRRSRRNGARSGGAGRHRGHGPVLRGTGGRNGARSGGAGRRSDAMSLEMSPRSPQWSPLRRSGTTAIPLTYGASVPVPQWSPLRRSGTTSVAPRTCSSGASGRNGARSGGAGRLGLCLPITRRALCRRNGARSGGAGRPCHDGMQPRPLIQPQWSPLRRSGTTRARRRCTQVRGMSRNGARSGGAGRRGCTACCASVTCAAMEPAPEERDDSAGRCACGSPCTGRNGARSGGAGRLPLIINDAFDQAVAAAMEPAPEERDDRQPFSSGSAPSSSPQGSPLRRSGTTDSAPSCGSNVSAPQWSPLRRSGTTARRGRRPGPAVRAAMEPAPEERDDLLELDDASRQRIKPQWSPLRRSGTTRVAQPRRRHGAGRNGARSGGAGRLFHLDKHLSGLARRNGARSGGAGRPAPRCHPGTA